MTAPVLAVQGATKRYGPTLALDGVSLALYPGEVVALMGANGAGKSTLVKAIAGAASLDRGTLTLAGQPYAPSSPRQAVAAGVVTVHQQTAKLGVEGLSVAENLVLDSLCQGRFPALAPRRLVRERAAAVADAVGLAANLDADFASLGPAQRQLVAIGRAVAADARVLLLDEPTATLSGREAEGLFATVDRLRARGLAILYVSHRLGDLRRLADRAVVLRNGRVAAGLPRPLDLAAALAAMLGEVPTPAPRDGGGPGPVVLEMDKVSLRPGARPLSLAVRAGEVVALTGPVGAGKSRLLRGLFGLAPFAGGSVRLAGRPWAPAGPAAAIAGGCHMAGEDRWRSSLVPSHLPGGDIAGAVALPHLPRWFPLGPLRAARERAAGAAAIRDLGIRATGPGARLDSLSGGNQQKVVLARWQAEPCRLLLLDEPFQGVDLGARRDIAHALRAAAAGRATLVATGDLEEALEVADRVVVLRDHAVAHEAEVGGGEVGGGGMGELLARLGDAVAGPAIPPSDTAGARA